MNDSPMFESIICPASAQAPRHSEAAVIQLAGGQLLLAWTEFYNADGADNGPARISARFSADLGRTWGEPFVLQDNDGRWNVMSVSLLRLAPGRILLFYLRKHSWSDLHLFQRRSDDEGCTWGAEVRVTDGPGYHVVNNDRVVRLSAGRLLAPVSRSDDVRQPTGHQAFCCCSDDEGRTWRAGATRLEVAGRGAMEPGVVELRDGRVLMIIRTQLGRIYRSFSRDRGATWSDPEPMNIGSPEAPASITRLPAGELLLVWNNSVAPGGDYRARRTPLTCAISRDEGETWTNYKNLEDNPRRGFAYTSIAFVGPAAGLEQPVPDRALLTYWVHDDQSGLIALKLKSLPLEWFYQ